MSGSVQGEQGPRRRLTAEERRESILDAANQVFGEHGFENVRIDDVATAAGISKALIYEHFTSKQALHADLIEAQASELYRRIADAVEAVETESGGARLMAGLEAYLEFVEERREAWRVLFRETVDPEAAAALDRVSAQVTALVAALIAQDPGATPRDEAHPEADRGIQLLAEMLVGAIQSVANWWDDHKDVRRERVLEAAMEFAWFGLERLGKGERWAEG
jgi:AcrR family transcriptional regulator